MFSQIQSHFLWMHNVVKRWCKVERNCAVVECISVSVVYWAGLWILRHSCRGNRGTHVIAEAVSIGHLQLERRLIAWIWRRLQCVTSVLLQWRLDNYLTGLLIFVWLISLWNGSGQLHLFFLVCFIIVIKWSDSSMSSDFDYWGPSYSCICLS